MYLIIRLIYTRETGIVLMILKFLDIETENVFNQTFSKRLPTDIQKIALRKLILIDNANDLNDLRIPPSNHLEKLSGKLDGRWSIRINDQWRICFVPIDGGRNYIDVTITDYH